MIYMDITGVDGLIELMSSRKGYSMNVSVFDNDTRSITEYVNDKGQKVGTVDMSGDDGDLPNLQSRLSMLAFISKSNIERTLALAQVSILVKSSIAMRVRLEGKDVGSVGSLTSVAAIDLAKHRIER